MHARMPKNFVLEERIERYADAIEPAPAAWRGRWARACAPAGGEPFRAVKLDLGCGKGSFLLEMAHREPDVLWLGVDAEPVCVVYAAEAVMRTGTRNVLVIPARADQLKDIFAAGELDAVTINFPTPFPRKKQAGGRVTTIDRLLEYRPLLASGARITLRTDSQPFLDYTRGQLVGAGYRLLWESVDVRAEHPDLPATEYETRLGEEGARALGICAMVGPEPAPEQIGQARRAPVSLFEYLPHDLYEGRYIPHGMDYAVTVYRNRRANEARRREARS